MKRAIGTIALSLRTKLTLSFLAVACLVGVVSLALVKNEHTLQEKLDILVDINMEEISHASQIVFWIQRIESNFRELMLETIVAIDEDDTDHSLQAIREGLSTLRRITKQWIAITSSDEDSGEGVFGISEVEELEELGNLSKLIDDFCALSQTLLLMHAEDPTQYLEQYHFFNTEIDPVSRRIQDAAKELWEEAREEAEGESVLFRNTLQDNVFIGLLLSLTAFLFASGFGIFFSHYFTTRLALLHQASMRILAGDFDTRIKASGCDELTAVAVGFNNMAEGLKKNIAARELAEEELRESEARFRIIFEQAAVGVALVETVSGRFIRVNRRYSDLLGYSPEEMKQVTFQEFTYPDDIAAELANIRRLTSGESAEFNMEKRCCRKDGSLIWCNLTVSPTWKAGEADERHIAIVEDITARKQAEEALQEAKEAAEAANRAKSIFLANMSHELRTPLNAILGFSEMIARDPATPEPIQEKIEIINRSGDHLLAMINDVLNLSKIEAGRMELEPQAFSLSQMLQDLGRMFEERAGSARLRFTLDLDPDLPDYIEADSGKLRQILINLLGNAAKFTEQGGFTLRATTRPLTAVPGMVVLQLEVRDSGPGIPQDQIEHIFEAFVQSQHPQNNADGTGLGLSISKSFVDLMGGEIGVESRLGEGARFYVELPVSLVQTEEAHDHDAAKPAVLGLEPGQPAWRILVVEDHPANRLLLNNLLKQTGFTVEEAENGEQAVTRFKLWRPDFIWMDMHMPVMDGYQATAKIRALPGGDSVKIAALSASAFDEQRQAILDAGCDEVVRKPFYTREVFAAMAKLLGVCYRYEERIEQQADKPPEVSSAAIAALPQALLESLLFAAESLNEKQFEAALAPIREYDPALAGGFDALACDFRFDLIVELLKAQMEENV